MYCDPVACICLATDNTYMVITARFRSILEYKVTRLRILFTDNIGILPLFRSTVSHTALHTLIQISIDH